MLTAWLALPWIDPRQNCCNPGKSRSGNARRREMPGPQFPRNRCSRCGWIASWSARRWKSVHPVKRTNHVPPGVRARPARCRASHFSHRRCQWFAPASQFPQIADSQNNICKPRPRGARRLEARACFSCCTPILYAESQLTSAASPSQPHVILLLRRASNGGACRSATRRASGNLCIPRVFRPSESQQAPHDSTRKHWVNAKSLGGGFDSRARGR